MNDRFRWCVYPALRESLEKTDYTRDRLAQDIGISASNVWFWLSGGNRRVIGTINKILSVTGLTYEQAFGGSA